MENMDILNKLPGVLLPWYEDNKRDLPWRKDREPYHVWLSEIMLQQTRVEAVKGYYRRFLDALPTIASLANCDDDALHKLWEGLGYYSRVRNLKKAAQVIMDSFGGMFPKSYEEVFALPGIGEYTAGAICSICYDQPTPAVDGNVLRVISRILNDDTPIDLPAQKKYIRSMLAEAYPEAAGDFTQSLMELGATVCGPNRKPDCGNCPCVSFCRAAQAGTAEQLPAKGAKKARRVEEMTVLVISCDGAYILEKRPEQGLLAGLWQFLNCKGKLDTQHAIDKVEEFGFIPREILRTVEKRHIFTHVEWVMTGVYVEVVERNPKFQWFTSEQIEQQAALPTAFRQFWEAAKDV